MHCEPVCSRQIWCPLDSNLPGPESPAKTEDQSAAKAWLRFNPSLRSKDGAGAAKWSVQDTLGRFPAPPPEYQTQSPRLPA